MNVTLFGWYREPLNSLIPGNILALVKTKMDAFLPTQSIEPHSPTQHLFLEIIYLLFMQISTEGAQSNNSDIQMSVPWGRERSSSHFQFPLHIFPPFNLFEISRQSAGYNRNESPTKTWRNVCWIRKQPWEYLLNTPACLACINFSVRNAHQRM